MSTQQDQSQAQPFEKRAEIAATDADRHIAVGVAMVPNSVDKSGDFERPETIQRLSEGYMERLATNEADNGIMHAAFPGTDTLTHVENRVLDAPEKIGDTEYPVGTWVVGKRVKDDRLWDLVQNGTLSGFSIGGHVSRKTEYIGSDIPEDISVPDEMREASEGVGFPITEIVKADVHEISFVDSPAVSEAQIQTAKAAGSGDGFLKAAPELTAGVDVATEYLVDERGHDETAARELAENLNRDWKSAAAPSGNSADPSGWVARAKSFFTPRGGGSGGQNATPDSPTDEMSDTDGGTEKAGRTLSSSNTDRVKALHDIAIDVLNDAGEANNRLRFTDDISTSFDVNEFQSKAASDDEPAESGRDADTDTENTMSDTDIEEMLKSIKETQEEQAERMEALESDDDGEEKAEDDDDPVADLAETVESLADQQGQILDRIENAEGASQQNPNADTDTDEGVSKADVLGLPNMGD